MQTASGAKGVRSEAWGARGLPPQPHFFLLRAGLTGPMSHIGDEKRGYWGDTPHTLRPAAQALSRLKLDKRPFWW